MPRLRFITTVEGANTIELAEPVITIGRGINNVVCIEDPNISKHHALLVSEGNTYRIFDLHSVNGTAVNGERITVATLKEGDAVRIGYLEMKYEIALPASVAVPQIAATAPTLVAPAAKPLGAPGPLVSRPRLGFGVSGKPTLAAPAGAVPAMASASATAVAEPPVATAPQPPPPVSVPPAKEEKRVMIRLPDKQLAPTPVASAAPPAPVLKTVLHPEPEPAKPVTPPAPVAESAPSPAPVEQPAATPEGEAAPAAPTVGPKKLGVPPAHQAPKFRLKRE